MKVTVILCTHNRCATLTSALESVAGSIVPPSIDWDVLVVDNNSRDQTREVIELFCRQHPGRFRYLFEPQQGKSHALNAGIKAAGADILAFMDDDVTVESTWLHNLTAHLNDGWAGVGGRILPEWNGSPPSWLALDGPYALIGTLAVFDRGPQAGELNEAPFGTNMAFQKAVFERHGGFRTDLGPHPDSMIRNEDTEFGRRLLAAHERLRYEPSAVVYHPMSEDRIQKKYFLAWWFDHGRAVIREFGIPDSSRCYWGIPKDKFRRLLRWTVSWIVAADPQKRFFSKIQVWGIVGEIVEIHRRSPEAKKGYDARS